MADYHMVYHGNREYMLVKRTKTLSKDDILRIRHKCIAPASVTACYADVCYPEASEQMDVINMRKDHGLKKGTSPTD